MIAHVAEAHEQRGRVVLRITSGYPSEVALAAAVRVARGFQSEIECLLIENSDLIALAGFSFARQISRRGGGWQEISHDDIDRQLRAASHAAGRLVERVTRAAEVNARLKVVRDEPLRALAMTCSECGPWNVVVLGEPVVMTTSAELQGLFENVVDTTGIILVSPRARRADGPIILAVDDPTTLQSMLRAADRLQDKDARDIVVLLLAETGEAERTLEGQVRLQLGDLPDVRIVSAGPLLGDLRGAAEVLRRLHGGFVIAQLGGLLVPPEADLRPLSTALECPLLLMR
jgi:hypothetical protein